MLKRYPVCDGHAPVNVCHVLFQCTEISEVRAPAFVTTHNNNCMSAAINNIASTYLARGSTLDVSI